MKARLVAAGLFCIGFAGHLAVAEPASELDPEPSAEVQVLADAEADRGFPGEPTAEAPGAGAEVEPSPPGAGALDPARSPADPPVPEAATEPASEPVAAARQQRSANPTATHVRMQLDVQGSLAAPAGSGAEPVREPITVEARFEFVESRNPACAAVRAYSEAQATIRVADRTHTSALPPDARCIEVAMQGTTPSPYLPGAFLSRAEADLLDTPFDPLLLDRLLPAAAVASGAKWTVPPDAVAGLLTIDTVDVGSVEVELVAVDDGLATLRVSGIVDGAADGVPSHVAVTADCTCAVEAAADASAWTVRDMRTVAATIRERRQASHVAPGFDVEARVTLARRPATASAPQPPPHAEDRRQGVGRPGLVWHRDPAGGFDLVSDARWRIVEDGPSGLVMRFVDRGALVAQCALQPLPRGGLEPPTLVEVQRDVERSLAGQFERFTHASESSRSDGVRVVRVITEGTAEKLPFRWIHYVLTDATGRRVAATFMCEASLAKRFAEADRELVDGLTFPGVPVAAPVPTRPPERAARVPGRTPTP